MLCGAVPSDAAAIFDAAAAMFAALPLGVVIGGAAGDAVAAFVARRAQSSEFRVQSSRTQASVPTCAPAGCSPNPAPGGKSAKVPAVVLARTPKHTIIVLRG